MSAKKQKSELFMRLAEIQQEIEYLEHCELPRVLKEIKDMRPTKKEIKENSLDDIYEWAAMNKAQ